MFLFIVELLSTTQEILRNSIDMQAYMNEPADLAALVTKLKAHAKELEEQDLKHVSELSKLTDQIKNLSANLETVMKNSQEQHEQMSRAIKTAEEKLASHTNEITAIHDNILGNLSILAEFTILELVGSIFGLIFFLSTQPQPTWVMPMTHRPAMTEFCGWGKSLPPPRPPPRSLLPSSSRAI